MNLASEQFAEIVAVMDRSVMGGKTDQRRAGRMEQHRRISIQPMVDEKPGQAVEVELLDFSTRGIGVLHTHAMACGEQFITRMERPGKPAVELLCTVAHSRPAGEGKHKIGAEFTCLISAATKGTKKSSDTEADRIRRKMFT